MSRYALVSSSGSDQMVFGAGVLVESFDPETGSVRDEDIIGITTGGITFQDVPEFEDGADGIDNAEKNMLEFMRYKSRTVTMSGTFISISPKSAARIMGMADIVDNKVTPRNTLKRSDFKDLWLVVDYSSDISEETGGHLAIKMINVMSTGGLQLKTTDAARGEFAFVFTAHPSAKQKGVPLYELYIEEGSASIEEGA